jgi:hypothetical protein
MALCGYPRRTATVMAAGYCDLHILERKKFESILNEFPKTKTAIEGKIAEKVKMIRKNSQNIPNLGNLAPEKDISKNPTEGSPHRAQIQPFVRKSLTVDISPSMRTGAILVATGNNVSHRNSRSSLSALSGLNLESRFDNSSSNLASSPFSASKLKGPLLQDVETPSSGEFCSHQHLQPEIMTNLSFPRNRKSLPTYFVSRTSADGNRCFGKGIRRTNQENATFYIRRIKENKRTGREVQTAHKHLQALRTRVFAAFAVCKCGQYDKL